MKIERALVLNLDIKSSLKGVDIGIEVGLRPKIYDILKEEEINEINEIISKVSNILNDAIVRDISKTTGLDLKHSEKRSKENIYDNLSDEHKEKIEKLEEDLEKITDPRKKVERLVDELINSILEV